MLVVRARRGSAAHMTSRPRVCVFAWPSRGTARIDEQIKIKCELKKAWKNECWPQQRLVLASNFRLVVVASVTSWGGCRCDDLTSNLPRRDARMDAIACRVGVVATRSSA